jgi:hypothetical protein
MDGISAAWGELGTWTTAIDAVICINWESVAGTPRLDAVHWHQLSN